MAQPLNIALAGLGTVGAGVIRLIEANSALIARRAGRPIRIARVVIAATLERTRERRHPNGWAASRQPPTGRR